MTRESLLGVRMLDLLNIAGAMFYETHFAPLLRMQGFFNEVALDFKRQDGSALPTLVNAAERRDEQGNLVFTRVTIFKATDRRRYERQLVEAQRAADEARREVERGLLAERAAAELREQFVAVLGHDLRNPLAAVASGTKLLRKEELSPKSERILGLMDNSIQRMGALINDVLDFARSRLGTGIEGFPDASGDIRATAEQVIAELSSAHPDRRVETRFAISGSPPVDHARFAQLFSNLLSNALTHGDSDQPVRVDLDVSGDALSLAVANSGKPIAPEVLPRLFQPLSRAGKPPPAGIGVGAIHRRGDRTCPRRKNRRPI